MNIESFKQAHLIKRMNRGSIVQELKSIKKTGPSYITLISNTKAKIIDIKKTKLEIQKNQLEK